VGGPTTAAPPPPPPLPPPIATGATLGPVLGGIDDRTWGERQLATLLIEPAADLRKLVTAFGPNCHPLPVSEVRATGSVPQAALLALDGNPATAWNARGFSPQAISLRFAATSDVVGVLVLAAMHPATGPAKHLLEPSTDGRVFAVGHIAQATMKDGAVYALIPPEPMRAQLLRIRSVASPSWIAWREVVAFGCMGPVTIPPQAKHAPPYPTESAPPKPAPQPPGLVFSDIGGGGACTTDADCMPSTCCQPKSCISKQHAPRCNRVGCPTLRGPMDHPGARCACQQGRCGALLPPAVAAKPKRPCACGKEDLLCQMRCSKRHRGPPSNSIPQQPKHKPPVLKPRPSCGCEPTNLMCLMKCKKNRK